MRSQELEVLLREYKNPSTKEDKLVLRKLEAVDALLRDCSSEEFVFANELTNEFCRLITLLREQNKKAAEAAQKQGEAVLPEGRLTGFVTLPDADPRRQGIPFETADGLLVDFYNTFRNEQKRKTEAEKRQYPEIHSLEELTLGDGVNSTVKDYVARIKTFTNRYMYELPRVEELWVSRTRRIDPVLFTYMYIELVLAEFDTKNEDRSVNKQKSNIQSALRKLNEFKRIKTAHR